jgi:hypothetical protein
VVVRATVKGGAESVSETRAELIRNLRAALRLDPDMNDEEE